METKITKSARMELVGALHERYKSASRAEKARILNEFCSLSGYHRKYAIRVLNGVEEPCEPARMPARRRLYDEAARQALIVLWEASDRVCGKRLKPLLGIMVLAMERHGHLHLDRVIRSKLLAMSAATIDRLLRDTKAVTRANRPKRNMLGLRRMVPIRTFADWKDPLPGSMEMDLVAHCGDVSRGSYVHSLVLTDIASGWIECTPLIAREGTLVVEALERVRTALPFPLRALDIDNGGEFLNETMVRYCIDHGIELTRSRPYRKNDQAWIEQKNGAVVRKLIGYRRLVGIAAAQALARLYAASRLFVNFFQPSFKLAEKTRNGARVNKRYLPPQTPCERLLSNENTDAAMIISIIRRNLDPDLTKEVELTVVPRLTAHYQIAQRDIGQNRPVMLKPGESMVDTSRIFSGPKRTVSKEKKDSKEGAKGDKCQCSCSQFHVLTKPDLQGHYRTNPDSLPPGVAGKPMITLIHTVKGRAVGGVTFMVVPVK